VRADDRLISLAAIATLTSLAVPAGASVSVGAADGHTAGKRAEATSGWRDGGRISKRRDEVVMDGSTAHVVVAVATTNANPQHPRYTSTIARRSPDGDWSRRTRHLGSVVGVDVNAMGDAVILSTRDLDQGAVVATRWPRGADHPRSRVIVEATDTPTPPFSTTMSANGDGDVAVLLTPAEGSSDRAKLLRKPSGEPWKRALTIGRPRYGGALDSIDITPTGAVIGAFKQDQTLSVRTLPLGSGTFGPATEVTTWPSIDDQPGDAQESRAVVNVGVNGDLATTWNRDESNFTSVVRLNIVPAKGRPWQGRFETDHCVCLLTVARDGAVVVERGLYVSRWNPESRSFTGGQAVAHFRDANEQGDVLIGGGIYGGPLQLWPAGEPRGPAVDSPREDQLATVLTGDRRVYVATKREGADPPEYHLRIRQF
jgi:hypothetical protein